MEKEKRKQLIDIYKKCSDDDLNQMILEGEESFEDGAYNLILAEMQKRGIGEEHHEDEPDDEDGFEVSEEIDFDKMNTADLMGVLVNLHTLDKLNFHLALAEAVRRKIDTSDITAYKKIVNGNRCEDAIKIEVIENPRPLVILNSFDEAGLYTATLDEEEIPYEIQIIVDDRDYKKAEMVTMNILPAPENE